MNPDLASARSSLRPRLSSSIFLLGLTCGLTLGWWFGQDSRLDAQISPPPQNSLAVTNDIASRLAAIESDLDRLISDGRGVGAVGPTNAAVWDPNRNDWKSTGLAGGFRIIESDGNFCALGANLAAAYDPTSGTWQTQTLSGAVTARAYQGSFCVLGAASVAVWDASSRRWFQQNLRGGKGIVVSQGNFGAVGDNTAIAWHAIRKTWSTHAVPSAAALAGADN